VHLQIGHEDASQRGQELSSFLRAVDFIDGVYHTELRSTVLILIQGTLKELVVADDDISLLGAERTPLLSRKLTLRIEVKTRYFILFVFFSFLVNNILENCRNNLFSSV
jgi:hypothetical protein